MLDPQAKLADNGITHHYKRTSMGCGFVRFVSGRIYYLPRRFVLRDMSTTKMPILQYGPLIVSGKVRRISRAFSDEASFKAALRILCRKVSEEEEGIQLRTLNRRYDFLVEDPSELMEGFDTGEELVSWLTARYRIKLFFETSIVEELKKLTFGVR